MNVMSQGMIPEQVLKLILPHLNTRDRYSSCICVSRAFCKAVKAAAADSLCLDVRSNGQRHTSLLQWLNTDKGTGLTSLRLTCTGANTLKVLQLPCQHLRELQLTICNVQLGADSSEDDTSEDEDAQHSMMQACTGLTKLHAVSCNFVSWRSTVTALLALIDLRHIHLHAGAGVPDALHRFIGTLLLPLVHLTHLGVLGSMYVEADALCHASTHCTQLQELHLSLSSSIGPRDVMQLTSLPHLTGLCLHETGCSSSLPPYALTPLTGLQVLSLVVLSGSQGNPGVKYLQPLTALRRLTGLHFSVQTSMPPFYSVVADLHANKADEPGVWQQLLQLCDGGQYQRPPTPASNSGSLLPALPPARAGQSLPSQGPLPSSQHSRSAATHGVMDEPGRQRYAGRLLQAPPGPQQQREVRSLRDWRQQARHRRQQYQHQHQCNRNHRQQQQLQEGGCDAAAACGAGLADVLRPLRHQHQQVVELQEDLDDIL